MGRKKRGMEGGKGEEWWEGGMKKFHFPFPCSMMTKMSTVVSQGYRENYALKTSHTADEIQVEHALWKAIYQNLPVLLILPFLVHF